MGYPIELRGEFFFSFPVWAAIGLVWGLACGLTEPYVGGELFDMLQPNSLFVR